jgi:hypothetical protein
VYTKLVALQNDLNELKIQVDELKNGMTEISTGTCRNPLLIPWNSSQDRPVSGSEDRRTLAVELARADRSADANAEGVF